MTIYIYIMFTNTHSHLNAQSINVSRAIVFGRPSSSAAEQSSILCRSSTLAVPFRWLQQFKSNRIFGRAILRRRTHTRLLRRHKLLCVCGILYCSSLFLPPWRFTHTEYENKIMNWPVKTRTRTPEDRTENQTKKNEPNK